jgi:hypothetical protein
MKTEWLYVHIILEQVVSSRLILNQAGYVGYVSKIMCSQEVLATMELCYNTAQ